ncbi:MAG: hypothetical protein IT324_05950 [Anaerolineae bacterium]|nr:hypothetical protein [Anaerolineae bacterium]
MSEATMRTVIAQAGYRRQRMLGGILILRLLDARPETIDAWYTDCNKLMTHWQTGQRLRYLQDIRQAEAVTPYSTDRVARVIRRMRHIPVTDARGAILVNSPALVTLLSTFFKRRSHNNWHIRFFHDESDALRWLAE